MRIASLLPAGTEWLAAFDAFDDLVARSHECDWPPAAGSAPVVTQAAYEQASSSAAIDRAVQTTLQDGLSLYDVDMERLRALKPDLIITQAQCEVCAVSLSQLKERVEKWTERAPELFSMQPMTLKEVFEQALRLGRKIDRLERAMSVLAKGEQRLRRFREETQLARHDDPSAYPSVACIEWMDPLMTAGHWMPDVVQQAGGRAVLTEQGRPSGAIEWEALREADPDVLAIMPCGFSIAETRADLSTLTGRPGWKRLRAVREGRVFLFDGNAYFNRPGPRLYRSIELLGKALHPATAPCVPESDEMQKIRKKSLKKG